MVSFTLVSIMYTSIMGKMLSLGGKGQLKELRNHIVVHMKPWF